MPNVLQVKRFKEDVHTPVNVGSDWGGDGIHAGKSKFGVGSGSCDNAEMRQCALTFGFAGKLKLTTSQIHGLPQITREAGRVKFAIVTRSAMPFDIFKLGGRLALGEQIGFVKSRGKRIVDLNAAIIRVVGEWQKRSISSRGRGLGVGRQRDQERRI